MRKQIIIASLAITLASGLQATTEEQVAANTIDIGLNSVSIESLVNTMAAFEDRINTLESKVTTLESFHLSTREFTVTDNEQYYVRTAGFADKITSLNFNDGEWLYIEAKGDLLDDGTIHTKEICTSDSRLTSYLNKYTDSTQDPMVSTWFHIPSENELTYIKHDFESLPHGLNWVVATTIWGEVLDFERLKLGASSMGAYTNVDVKPINVSQFVDGDMWLTSIYLDNPSPTNIATYRVGTTRLQACGF